MARKKYIKIPKEVAIKCSNCGKTNKLKLKIDDCPQSFECKRCSQKILTPPSKCCIVCAFTNKKCPASLLMEAKIKGLKIK